MTTYDVEQRLRRDLIAVAVQRNEARAEAIRLRALVEGLREPDCGCQYHRNIETALATDVTE